MKRAIITNNSDLKFHLSIIRATVALKKYLHLHDVFTLI